VGVYVLVGVLMVTIYECSLLAALDDRSANKTCAAAASRIRSDAEKIARLKGALNDVLGWCGEDYPECDEALAALGGEPQ
jgi:hypothetical protein